MQLTIQKAKLISETAVEYKMSETDDNRGTASGVITLNAPVHADLKQAFANLALHLACMSGCLKSSAIKDVENPKPELIEDFHCKSFSIGGGDDPGVTLSGHRLLPNKKAFNFNTPFYRFEQAEETGYAFMDDLQSRLDRLDTELRAFIDGSKRGTDPQLNIFEEPKVNNIKMQPPISKDEADADAMKRVAAWDHKNDTVSEDAIVVETEDGEKRTLTKVKTLPPAAKGKGKRVAQSAAAPSGEISE